MGKKSEGKTYLVGIGASAGGLEAISQFIAHLKPELPCAYVVLQHLSPSHRSMMADILGRETPLAVREARHGERPQAGTIYVVPANHNALIKEGCLHLETAPPEVVPKPSINQFLISLAAAEGEFAIGIVLSGTGTDGTAGLRAIQAAGGHTLAQAPESAKYDGMPRAAIDAGVVDHVLPPDGLAARLAELVAMAAPDTDRAPPDLLERLLTKLRQSLQVDFSGYKTGTLMRRIRRREVATGHPDLPAYLRWVDSHPEELDRLARDILISVTAFFRDRDAFDALRRQIQEICARKSPGSEIRVWVAGCASGEEAYSVAILLAEALGERIAHYRVQIFGTDIDDEALNVARRGIYPAAALAELSPALLERHFRAVNRSFEVAKHLRDMVVFARHNLVSDPPFLRLDLVSCRNVLIYFDAPLQARVLQTFHFGLVKDGLLFLGRSESVAQAERLFVPLERRERLFRKSGDAAAVLPGAAPAGTARPPMQRPERRADLLLAGLVRRYDLTVLLCDEDGNIRHSAGQVERFLQFPSGAARLNLFDVAVPALRGEMLTLFHRCQQTGKAQSGRRRKVGENWVRVSIEPLSEAGTRSLMVTVAPEQVTAEHHPENAAPARPEIEDELLATREHLQTLIEEMATANEEMQALNEEAQAANEELQATNEELEAANEELQATNEELVSLNEELGVKTQELSRLNAEYTHLYDALSFPILVFDRHAQLTRFNAPAARRFDLRPTALHQHVSRLRLVTGEADIEQLLGCVLAHGDREERQITQDGRHLRLAVTPGLDASGQVISLIVTLIDNTEITQALARLKESQARMNALMEKTTVKFALKDPSGAYLYANRRLLTFFGLADDYLGKTDFQLLPAKLAADFWALDLASLRERVPKSGEHRVERDGGTRILHSVHQAIFDAEGKPTAIIVEAEDITARKHAEEQLRITARVFDHAGEAIVVTDPHSIIQTVNEAFVKITGYSREEAVGQPTTLLKSGRHSAEFYRHMWQSLMENGFWQGEIWNKRKNGEIYPEWLTISRIDDEAGRTEHYVAVFSDISQIKDSQRKAEYLATHDPLTSLPNRALFHDRLRHALAQARRNQGRVALLFIDLDNFKTINDTLGHDVGDEVLKQAANRLRDVVRDVDTVARLGGDEFTALLCDCDAEAVDRIARRIINDLAASFEVGGRKLFLSASVGVAFYPDDGEDSAELIKKADSAMYRAKEQGRNRVEFFKAELHVRLLRQAALESGLREALRNGHLRLVYQPKFQLAPTHRLLGAEALLRWTDPTLGRVSPADFIPVAEASGLIVEIDHQVQTLLIGQLAEWQRLGLAPPPIAFNASPRSIREHQFAERLLELAQQAGVTPALLQLEITEGALLEHSDRVLDTLHRLHEAGVRIAVDDFGTGYSSLNYLKRLPIDELKIDKSFVDGLGQDKEDEAITRAVLGMAHALGMTTVAEGIETDRQLAWLVQMGCTVGQGYHLQRPMEAVEFEDLLARTTES
ncbi:PAS domain S-box protein [Zoogloeaceae bacteirum Par-f-2]|nr:PAS domain S-box protein [Zoogloeaceae bacteirum Par-f-2]